MENISKTCPDCNTENIVVSKQSRGQEYIKFICRHCGKEYILVAHTQHYPRRRNTLQE